MVAEWRVHGIRLLPPERGGVTSKKPSLPSCLSQTPTVRSGGVTVASSGIIRAGPAMSVYRRCQRPNVVRAHPLNPHSRAGAARKLKFHGVVDRGRVARAATMTPGVPDLATTVRYRRMSCEATTGSSTWSDMSSCLLAEICSLEMWAGALAPPAPAGLSGMSVVLPLGRPPAHSVVGESCDRLPITRVRSSSAPDRCAPPHLPNAGRRWDGGPVTSIQFGRHQSHVQVEILNHTPMGD